MARRLLDTRPSMPLDLTKAKRRKYSRSMRSGFTLVELAIVVTIVGVLSVIAVVGYRKLTLQAKISEAQNMISSIRIAQENYRTERGVFANVGPNYCPSKGDTQQKFGWNPACVGGGTSPTASWRDLPVHTDGPVQFGYNAIAGPPTGLPAVSPQLMNFAGANIALPWFVAQAQADLNGDGAAGVSTLLIGTSFNNVIGSMNEGE